MAEVCREHHTQKLSCISYLVITVVIFGGYHSTGTCAQSFVLNIKRCLQFSNDHSDFHRNYKICNLTVCLFSVQTKHKAMSYSWSGLRLMVSRVSLSASSTYAALPHVRLSITPTPQATQSSTMPPASPLAPPKSFGTHLLVLCLPGGALNT